MRITTYQRKAHETAIYPADKALDYLVPGLLVEVIELRIAVKFSPKFVGELGDITWFAVEICGALGIDVNEVYSPPPAVQKNRKATIAYYEAGINQLIGWAASICNLWVKAVRDKNSVLSGDDVAEIRSKLVSLFGAVEALAALHDKTLSDVFQANIKKLASRAARGVISGNGDER